jgi:hypothetical protein
MTPTLSVEITVEWGDGLGTASGWDEPQGGEISLVELSHVYSSPGEYHLRATVLEPGSPPLFLERTLEVLQ